MSDCKCKYDKLEHLKLIQALITRLSTQTTTIKGFTVTVASGLIGLWLNFHQPAILVVGIAATYLFWRCDAYYNSRSERYWKLYNEISKEDVQTNYAIEAPTTSTDLENWGEHPFYGVFYKPICVGFLLLLIWHWVSSAVQPN